MHHFVAENASKLRLFASLIRLFPMGEPPAHEGNHFGAEVTRPYTAPDFIPLW
jgi:hypothetical protein